MTVKRKSAPPRKRDILMLILFAGFLVRMLVISHPGYGFDVGVYIGWAKSAVLLGLADSYTQQIDGNMLPNYPPFSLMLFNVIGDLYYHFVSPEMNPYAQSFHLLIKAPAIFFDLLTAALLYGIVKKWKSKKAGLIAAAAFTFNPAVIFNSTVWGQTDCIFTFFLVLSVACWVYDHPEYAAATLALAVLTKVQGIVLFPLFAFLLYKDLKGLLRFTLAGIGMTLIVLSPYIAGNALEPVMNVYLKAAGTYGNVSVGAYNLWWALLADRAWQITNTEMLFNVVSYKHAGILLCIGAYGFILAVFRDAIRKPGNPEAFFFCSALLAFAFFLFLPEMHERYLFPFVGLGIPLLFVNRVTARLYWITSIAFWFNMMGVLQFTKIDKALYSNFDTLDVFIASTTVLVFFFLLIEAYHRYAPKPFLRLPERFTLRR